MHSSLLTWYLLWTLDPPIPDELVPGAERAVDLVRAGLADRPVDLPGRRSVRAGELVEHLGLGYFVDR